MTDEDPNNEENPEETPEEEGDDPGDGQDGEGEGDGDENEGDGDGNEGDGGEDEGDGAGEEDNVTTTDGYEHGVYGVLKDSVIASVDEATTATVAVGTLPVHLLADYTGLVGAPLPMADSTAKSDYGYSTSWDKFTLCEVMQGFLGASSGNIGGLYCINVLDPSSHKKGTDTTTSLTFADGVAVLDDELAIVSTIAVDGVTAANTSAAYDWSTGKITIKATGATGAKTVTYRQVDVTAVTTADFTEAIGAIDDLYPLYNVVPDLILAPGWSQTPAIYAALVEKAQSVNGHFLGFVLAASTSAATVEAAIAWKASNGYTSKFSKACWPCVTDLGGDVYHLSTLFAREMARKDADSDGVPYKSASNTALTDAGVCLADGTAVKIYDEEGNHLNAYGISTAKAWGGVVRLWGGHTAGYIYGASGTEASAVFDTNIRMLCHLVNGFQRRWVDEIDQPMTLALRDTILFSEQGLLDGLVARGALVGNPKIRFSRSSNTDSDIVQGVFTWDVEATPTPQFKTARAVVAYTTEGFDAYITEGGE